MEVEDLGFMMEVSQIMNVVKIHYMILDDAIIKLKITKTRDIIGRR